MLDTTLEHPYAAAVIRFPATGPEWYENGSHIARGFDTSVAPEILPDGRLSVALITSMPVGYAVATGDETFTERNILAGVSGGVGAFNISLSIAGSAERLDLADPVEYAKVAGNFANLWLYASRVPPLVPTPA